MRRCPHALLLAGRIAPGEELTRCRASSRSIGSRTSSAKMRARAHFVPIGSNGFYQRGGERALFDQQPVEAQAMVSACLEAYRITGDRRWHKDARRAFAWFLGRNDLSLSIYDPITGGCRDGLHPDRPNSNQGAESTLAFLQCLLELPTADTHANLGRATLASDATRPETVAGD